MRYSLVLALALFGMWLLWSGHYGLYLLGCGIVSTLLVVLLSRRMNIVDSEGVPVQLGLRPILYAPWLLKEMVVANLEVARRILTPRLPIKPVAFRIRSSQKRDLARVIYANSITLTPGTVSIDMEEDQITVHALSHEGAKEDISSEMDRRVSRLEGAS